MQMQKKILALEKNNKFAKEITKSFAGRGWKCDIVDTIDGFLNASFEKKYDFYILALYKAGDVEIMEDFKDVDNEVPIACTSSLQDISTMERAFKLGAVEYLKKPFYAEELAIRIEAYLARGKSKEKILRCGKVELDLCNETLKVGGIIEANPGAAQVALLKTLMQNANSPVLKEDLLSCLRRPTDTALRASIFKIRNKYGLEIESIRGRGYVLRCG